MSENNNNNNNNDNVTPIRPKLVEDIKEQALQGAAEELTPEVQRWEIQLKSGEQFTLDGDLSIYGNIYVLSDVARTPIWSASADQVSFAVRLDTSLG